MTKRTALIEMVMNDDIWAKIPEIFNDATFEFVDKDGNLITDATLSDYEDRDRITTDTNEWCYRNFDFIIYFIKMLNLTSNETESINCYFYDKESEEIDSFSIPGDIKGNKNNSFKKKRKKIHPNKTRAVNPKKNARF
jgi:hypothetical protein